MGELDEILKQTNTWSKKIVSAIQSLQIVKQRQEASGFQNTWSGLNDIEREIIQLQDINRSGFASFALNLSGLEDINRSGILGIWSRLDTKISQEASGFDIANNISGIRQVRDEVIQLQGINTDIQSGVAQLRAGEFIFLASGVDISSGVGGAVAGELGCYDRWTLYITTSADINITIDLSPNSTANWFTIPEAPLVFSGGGAQTDVLEFGYDCTNIRLYGDTGALVTAIAKGCW